MQARAEITAKYARAYRVAKRVEKGVLLDELVAVSGRARDHARPRLRRRRCR